MRLPLVADNSILHGRVVLDMIEGDILSRRFVEELLALVDHGDGMLSNCEVLNDLIDTTA